MMNVNVNFHSANLGCGLTPLIPTWRFSSSLNPRVSLLGMRLTRTGNFLCQCSVLNQQQKEEEEKTSFSEPENQLIEALIGIQGRGRSASRQQLNVCLETLIFGLARYLT